MPISGSRSKDVRLGREEGAPRLAIEGVTPGYFQAVGIEIVEGRDFDERDYDPGAPGVFIVSETLARRFWPGESAVGKRLTSGEAPPKDGRWSTVVGVVKDMRREGLDRAPIMGAFTPAFPRGMDLTIRASIGERQPDRRAAPGDSRDRSLAALAAGRQRATAISRIVSAAGASQSQALGLFAAIALVVSAAGLYAILAYQVTLRTREIGIRSALGADRQTILTMILRQGLWLTASGTAVGLMGAAAGSRVMQSLLYETASHQRAELCRGGGVRGPRRYRGRGDAGTACRTRQSDDGAEGRLIGDDEHRRSVNESHKTS